MDLRNFHEKTKMVKDIISKFRKFTKITSIFINNTFGVLKENFVLKKDTEKNKKNLI